jgi:protein-S-isoprenylcysteine O-methyltransferase Ste14
VSALDLKIPPIVVVFVAATSMWVSTVAFPMLGFGFPANRLIAALVMGLGVTVTVLGAVSFRRASTTLNPMKPESASALVVSDIYTLTRNPMYLGFLLMLVGWAIFLANILSFVFLPLFVFYMTRFQITPEERALEALFGEQFRAYKNKVRRWI